jgi:hypothetical protein
MDKNRQNKPPLLPMMAAALAPVVAFILANALFLPLVLTLSDFGDSDLAGLIPASLPGGGYLTVAALVLLFPLSAAAVAFGPALVSFGANLVSPVLTTWSRAFWCGGVFFVAHMVLLIILLVVRNIPLFPPPAPVLPFPAALFNPFPSFPIDPLSLVGLLAGVVLSGSVTLFGRLGAWMRRRTPKAPATP